MDKKRRTVYVTDDELSCIKTFLSVIRMDVLPTEISMLVLDDKSIKVSVRKSAPEDFVL